MNPNITPMPRILGHIVFPFAASLVLIWDTLAMTLGVPKKQLSVEFRDLHLYTQPVMHDQRRLKLSLSLHRGTGSFEVTQKTKNENCKKHVLYISITIL